VAIVRLPSRDSTVWDGCEMQGELPLTDGILIVTSQIYIVFVSYYNEKVVVYTRCAETPAQSYNTLERENNE